MIAEPTARQYFYPRPPRGGRQARLMSRCGIFTNFYPRPPRGGRPAYYLKKTDKGLFLSTPSARRATSGSE